MKIVDQFLAAINKYAAKNKAESLYQGSFNDPVGWARKSLNIDSNKYPPDMSGESTLPDGRLVKLITVDEAKRQGLKHRMYVRCKYCEKWIPAGRINQHEAPCLSEHQPTTYKSKIDFKRKVSEFLDQISSTNSLKDREEMSLVLADMLEERSDMGWESLRKMLKRDAKFFKLKRLILEEFEGIKHIVPTEDGAEVMLQNLDGTYSRLSVTLNPDDSLNIINKSRY